MQLNRELLIDRLSRLKLIDSEARYGPPGSAIPGSLLCREYCRQCGLAIRVPTHAVGKYVLCLVCDRDRREHRPTAA